MSTLYLIHVPRVPVIRAGLIARILFTVGAWWALRPHRRPRPARHRRAATAPRPAAVVLRETICSHRRRPPLDDPEWTAAIARMATRMAPHHRAR